MKTTKIGQALALVVVVAMMSAWGGEAEAFCGFYVSGADAEMYNDATMVVMMREGQRTVLSMRNNYSGPPEDFAMVVPSPVVLQKENVKVLPDSVFDKVDGMAAPRLVEYWERDPCYSEPVDLKFDEERREEPSMAAEVEGSVRVEAEFEVGEYDVVVLSAQDSTSLDTWLRQNDYNIPEGAAPVLKPYVEGGMYFFVAKVDVQKVNIGQDGRAELSPLRFHYDSKTFNLPIRLGLINARGKQDLLVHILARGTRYEAANYDNVTIPTNIDVSEDVKGRYPEFYAALFDETLAKNPGAVVTEYAWDASTCDPCPGPNLDRGDFQLLGADTLPPDKQWGFVLTRLHARYDSSDLGEDLVFKEAPAIAGGREVRNANQELEHGATSAGRNNFQGRYIIRHPWEGEILCLNPRRGVWGGPNGRGSAKASSAQDTAFAPRGELDLPSVLRQDIPELDITGKAEPIDLEDAGLCGSCACATPSRTTSGAGGGALAGLLLLIGAAVVARRRRGGV